ncbi:hypothetical protein KR093_006926 [Drosophila rubida]|uniref:Anaphase-promoting complex subunit CDC26 n=1 Tax=Drosophila rubida TaxID=30044 RepID=A0AAD4KB82_9MUSC|nr:hypothetical protein KR093_006926 [Drosophila rubida]
MLKRNLQSIQLTLADLEEYENVRRRNKTKAAIEASRCSSVPTTATETVPSSSTSSTSEIIQEQPRPERSNVPGWTTATIADSNTNSGSTEDDTSVQAVIDDNDTIAEFSDDGWVDIDEEDEDAEEEGAVGGEI